MKCPHCGKENSSSAKFCTECGKKIVLPKVTKSDKSNKASSALGKIFIILFLILSAVGVFGQIKGVSCVTFFKEMWPYLANIQKNYPNLYGFEATMYALLFISFMVAVLGSVICLIYRLTELVKAASNKSFLSTSDKHIFLYSFMFPLQYLIYCNFNFFAKAEYSYGGSGALTSYSFSSYGWGGILIIIGLVFGLVASFIEELEELRNAKGHEISKYITRRISLLAILVIIFFGSANYVHYGYNYTGFSRGEWYDYEYNIFVIIRNALRSSEITSAVLDIRRLTIFAIIFGIITIFASFAAFTTLLKNEDDNPKIALPIVLICSTIITGSLALQSAKTYYSGATNYNYHFPIASILTIIFAVIIIVSELIGNVQSKKKE